MTDSSNVSVIIVSFQSDAALMSLFPSIPENVELIIVNNSPDQSLEKLKKVKIKPLGIEGYSKSEWVLIDFGDVLVHVMHPEAREFYSLEKLWDESLNSEQMI